MITRRALVKGVVLGAGLPLGFSQISAEELAGREKITTRKGLAEIALNFARQKGIDYVDVRIGRYYIQSIDMKNGTVKSLVNGVSSGIGIRVLHRGVWGFAASNQLTAAGVQNAVLKAISEAKANSRFMRRAVQFAPSSIKGEHSWQTPIKVDAFKVATKEKLELLKEASYAALAKGVSYIDVGMKLLNEQKYFASSDGQFIDQDTHKIWTPFQVLAIADRSNTVATRDSLAEPMGMGYEYLELRPQDRKRGKVTLYNLSYDLVDDAIQAAIQAKQKLKAPRVRPGKFDIVIDPSHLGLALHESVGRALELDRILAHEATHIGGGSHALSQMARRGLQFGNEKVGIFADRTQPGGLASVKYDDEGIKTKQWDMVKAGVLVDLNSTRDTAHHLDDGSHGCSYADNWSSVQMQRMPNVSLKPGTKNYSVEEMIGDVDNGFYLVGKGFSTVNQQSGNFEMGADLCFEIKKGQIKGIVNGVAYQDHVRNFWRKVDSVCDKSDYRLSGIFNDEKGIPPQFSAVSHGSATTRMNDVMIINTQRRN